MNSKNLMIAVNKYIKSDMWNKVIGVLQRYKAIDPYFGHSRDTIRYLDSYFTRTPNIYIDHGAFRAVNLPHMSNKNIFRLYNVDKNYKKQDNYYFDDLKVNATWFSLNDCYKSIQDNINRLFISEMETDYLKPETIDLICQISDKNGIGSFDKRSLSYETIQKIRELENNQYLEWFLHHSFDINHLAFRVDFFTKPYNKIDRVRDLLMNEGIELNKNTNGEPIVTSKDGLLRQFSTMADISDYEYSCGTIRKIPHSFVEFIQRDWDATNNCIKEGFEVGNAEVIFNSTRITL